LWNEKVVEAHDGCLLAWMIEACFIEPGIQDRVDPRQNPARLAAS